MNLGMCSGCRNKSEVHRGNDGKNYCEDCLAKNAFLDPMSRHTEVEGAVIEPPKDRRNGYLEYIITHVTDEWIDKFLGEWMLEMKRSYGWVQELRKITDDMVLLRLAAELGYGKRVEYQPPVVEVKTIGDIVAYADSDSGRKPKRNPKGNTDTKGE